jgi:hypothetical protein
MNRCNNIASSGAIIVTLAFVPAGGQNLSRLIVGMILLNLGNRAALVGNQTRIYALRAETHSRLNTVCSRCPTSSVGRAAPYLDALAHISTPGSVSRQSAECLA